MDKTPSTAPTRSPAPAETDLPGLVLAAVPPVMVAIRDTVRGFASPERTLLQFRVLSALLAAPSTITELSQATGASAAAVSKVVASMADLRLVERRPDAADRRVTHLALTGNGRARAVAMLAAVRAALTARLADLTAADRRRLAQGLAVLGRLFARGAAEPSASRS